MGKLERMAEERGLKVGYDRDCALYSYYQQSNFSDSQWCSAISKRVGFAGPGEESCSHENSIRAANCLPLLGLPTNRIAHPRVWEGLLASYLYRVARLFGHVSA